jgi:DNA-directed RNA polymerase alpha subunit
MSDEVQLVVIEISQLRQIIKDCVIEVLVQKRQGQEIKADVFDTYLHDMDLTTRLYNVLRFLDCKNIRDILRLNKKTLMSTRGFGERSWNELTERLSQYGIDISVITD